MLWPIVFVAGSLGGALCDQIHVQSGVLAYPHPWLADQAWWVAPQFGVGMIVVLAAARIAVRGDTTRPPTSRVAIDAAWFLGVYAASGLGHGHPVALAVAFVVTWLARRPDRRGAVPFSILLSAGGVLYEGTLAGSGAFHYARPDLFHVPVWLAGIYLHGALLALSVARLTSRSEEHTSELQSHSDLVCRLLLDKKNP